MRRYLQFKLHILSIILTAMLIAPNLDVRASGVEEITEGTEYWLAIPYCKMLQPEFIRGEFPLALWISSKVNTKATVTAESIGYQRSFNIEANKITQVPLSDALMCNEGEVVKRNGIHIKADNPISVCVYQSYRWSGEAFRVIPVDWLGKKYVTLNLYQDETDEIKPAQILIVATEDNTTVRYVPPKPTEKVNAGQVGEAVLMKGESFLILSRPNPGLTQDFESDITGTYITSNKPIVCISGHTKGSFPRFYVGSRSGWQQPYANFSRNMLVEMMWPIELLGKEYISAPIKYKDRPYIPIVVSDIKGDLIRFVATEDGTEIEQLRKDGSSYMRIGPVLKRGQWYNLTNMEDPAMYRANKPFLVGQYGKTWWNENGMMGIVKEGDEPQNPHRSGQGMLLVLAPLERWVSYANFRSPYDIDNFVYITFKMDDFQKMKFDGQSLIAKFGSALREIPGTEYGYIAENIAPGDHWIEAEEGVRFAGYAYGNWDNVKDGFAYGYPIGINYATPCEDTLRITETIECGVIDGVAEVVPDAECASLFSVRFQKDASINYHDAIISEFERGVDRKATFLITPIDPNRPGKAVMSFMTKSGKAITKTYEYIPEEIVGEPTVVNFGLLKVGETVCKHFDLKNEGKVDATVKKPLRLQSGRNEFVIDSDELPVTLKPGETKRIEVCATALQLEEGVILDSVIADLSCAPKTIVELRFVTGETIVTIEDMNWGKVPVGAEIPKQITIENIGSTPVELYSMDWVDKVHFTKVENLNFPLTLPKNGDKHVFTAYYKPDVPGVQHTTRATFVGNTDRIKLYSDWIGEGTDAGPAVIGYDWKQRRVIDQWALNNGINDYEYKVTIKNTGSTADLIVKNVEVTNDPDGVFRLDLTNLPATLGPLQQHEIKAYFAPKEQKAYNSKVLFTADFNGEIRYAEDDLKGIGTQPHIDIKGKTFATPLLVGDSEKGMGEIHSIMKFTNQTAMDLTIFDQVTIEGPDAAAFRIDQKFFTDNPYPIVMRFNTTLDVPITFTATKIGEHNAKLIAKVHDAPENPEGPLVGYGRTEGLETTDLDLGLDFVTMSNSGSVYIINNGSTALTINEPPVITSVNADNDYQSFTVLRYYTDLISNPNFPLILNNKEKLYIEVELTRAAPKKYAVKIDYFTTLGKATSLIWGEGKVIWTRVRIPEYTKKPNGTDIYPGDVVRIDYFLDKHPNEAMDIETANIKTFEATVKFKQDDRPSEIIDAYPKTSGANGQILPADIHLDGTLLSNGWKVDEVRIDDYKTLFVKFSGTTPLKGNGVLFRFDMQSYLSDLKKVPLEPDLNPIYPYVYVDKIPGSIEVSPVCVNDLRLVILSASRYALSQVMPNPVRDKATIEYTLGIKANAKLTIYNSYGDEAAVLVNKTQDPGTYKVDFSADDLKLSSGVYYYKLESGPFTKTESLVITK